MRDSLIENIGRDSVGEMERDHASVARKLPATLHKT